ncbi:UNVERIFIED_CONTAM: FUSC family protein, partial [Microbacterium sp. SLM126]
ELEDLGDLEASARYFEGEDENIHIRTDFLLDEDEASRNVRVAFVLTRDVLFSIHDEDLPVFRLVRLRARMLDRLAQLVPRLAASASEVSSDGFSEVRVELTALALQREMPAMPDDARHAVRRVLRSIAGYYKARLDGTADAPPPALRTRLDNARQKVQSPVALAALVDMQVALFPPAVPATVSGKA